MYTEKTLRGLSRFLCAIVLVIVVTCIAMVFVGGNSTSLSTVAAVEQTNADYSDGSETVTEAVATAPPDQTRAQARVQTMSVAENPTYYNWEIQDDGILNDRNFGKNLWSEALTKEDALGLFRVHMANDPRACAATALGLSKELGFAVMPDEQSITSETERVNAAAEHYVSDHAYWQADYDAIMSAISDLKYDVEAIGDYSSACYMVFNGYTQAPTVIVSPSTRTGGHALVFYKSDGGKVRFRLECSFQLVDVLIMSENEPEPDNPEITTTQPTTTQPVITTTQATTTQSVTTTTSAPTTTSVSTTVATTMTEQTTSESTTKQTETTTTSSEATTVPTETTSIPTETTTKPTETTLTQTTTVPTETTTSQIETTTSSEQTTQSTTTSTTESTTQLTTESTTQSTSESTTTSTSESTTQPTTESTTESTTASTTQQTTESTTSTQATTESTTSTEETTTTVETTTEATTTEPTTTTTLESKDPGQAPDVSDDPDIGGGNSGDTDTDVTPEPDLPGAPAANAQPSPVPTAPTNSVPTNSVLETANVTMPPKNGVALVQQVLGAD